MHKREGFTAIELVVVIVVIGILLSIGIIGYRSTQISARDREREADVQALAAYIESTYSQEYRSGSTIIKQVGAYPQRDIFYSANAAHFDIVFADLTRSAMYAPGAGSDRSFMSNNNPDSETGLNSSNILPQSSTPGPLARYIYVPLTAVGGQTCTTAPSRCRTFQIYYQLEGKPGYQVLESKRK